jgi:FKBP-type peptidyl-prolyl cis-trans isomerase
MKKLNLTIILVIVLIIIIAAIYLFSQQNKMTQPTNQNQQPEQQNPQTSSSYEIEGMKVEILKEGTGEAAKTGDTVSVHYVGTLENGTKFDSSIDRGEPFSFTLGENRVIQGWELGVLGMKVGEKRKLTIPSDLAYGNQAVGGVIPANATLVFEVELMGIN